MAKKVIKMDEYDQTELLFTLRAKHTAVMIMICIIVFLSGWLLGRAHYEDGMKYDDTVLIDGEVFELREVN